MLAACQTFVCHCILRVKGECGLVSDVAISATSNMGKTLNLSDCQILYL